MLIRYQIRYQKSLFRGHHIDIIDMGDNSHVADANAHLILLDCHCEQAEGAQEIQGIASSHVVCNDTPFATFILV
jgi:hypothetical protein